MATGNLALITHVMTALCVKLINTHLSFKEYGKSEHTFTNATFS